MQIKHIALLVLLSGPAVVGGCSKGEQSSATSESAAAPASEMPGTSSAPGREPSDDLRSKLTALEGAGNDSLVSMLPDYRQAAANTIAQFNREMREMNMTADAAWTATVDSLRNDLTTMPELSVADLRALLPAHRTRITRLLQSHQDMMKAMGM